MIHLSNSRLAWGSDKFAAVLKAEVQTIAQDVLPLHVSNTQGGMFDFSDVSVSILSANENNEVINLMVGVFFTELIGGCNCADDPSPVNSWGKLQIAIDKNTSAADFVLLEQN